MGYVLRVRLASFFTGAATASFLGLYILYKDYKVAHESIAQRVLPYSFFALLSMVIMEMKEYGGFSFVLVARDRVQDISQGPRGEKYAILDERLNFDALGVLTRQMQNLVKTLCAYVFHFSLCFKVKRLHEPLDRRISALESLKQGETSQHVEATE
ncbi:hypothetical protein Golob_013094 [Gossypium lobatum]|uniref:Uncharacterized protein n=2 Tax=Gossypium TaxID=3633 RepID=A0A7J8LNF2_9ROSI|nr:hypothetical protein [Gossypium lobatum]